MLFRSTNTNPLVRIDWYDNAVPPNKLGSGNSFTTPSLTTTTTYYAGAVDIGPAGCVSPTRTLFLAEILPNPSNTNTQPADICSGTNFALTLTANPATALHTWTATCNPAGAVTGFTLSQVTPVSAINDLLLNTTTSNATVTYHLTPHLNSCTGPTVDLTVTVKPTPHLMNTAPTPICGLATFNSPLLSDVTGGNFTWTATCSPAGAVTGFTAIQATNVTVINDPLVNTTAATATVTYAITPHASGCNGPVTDYTVTLEPTPHLTNTTPGAVCSGDAFNASLLSDVSGADFTWTAVSAPLGAVTGFTASQTTAVTQILESSLINNTAGIATVTYHITPHANGCNGPVTDLTLTVNPTPHLMNSAPAPICSGGAFNASLLPDVAGGNFSWTATCNPPGSVTGFTLNQVTGVTIINEPLTNTTASPATVIYHIIPHAN